MVYILMGVAGSGKTTVGKKMSKIFNYRFYDADSFHPQINIDKMKQRLALDDNDRLPWLLKLSEHIKVWNSSDNVFLACSSLKSEYRKILTNNYIEDVKFIYLDVEYNVALNRLNLRKDHFFSSSLLQSQFNILEISNEMVTVNANQNVELICEEIGSIIKDMNYE